MEARFPPFIPRDRCFCFLDVSESNDPTQEVEASQIPRNPPPIPPKPGAITMMESSSTVRFKLSGTEWPFHIYDVIENPCGFRLLGPISSI